MGVIKLAEQRMEERRRGDGQQISAVAHEATLVGVGGRGEYRARRRYLVDNQRRAAQRHRQQAAPQPRPLLLKDTSDDERGGDRKQHVNGLQDVSRRAEEKEQRAAGCPTFIGAVAQPEQRIDKQGDRPHDHQPAVPPGQMPLKRGRGHKDNARQQRGVRLPGDIARQHVQRPTVERQRQQDLQIIGGGQRQGEGEQPGGEELQRVRPHQHAAVHTFRVAERSLVINGLSSLQRVLEPPDVAAHLIGVAVRKAGKRRTEYSYQRPGDDAGDSQVEQANSKNITQRRKGAKAQSTLSHGSSMVPR